MPARNVHTLFFIKSKLCLDDWEPGKVHTQTWIFILLRSSHSLWEASTPRLRLEILSIKFMNRIGDKEWSPTLTGNKSESLPAMQTKLWHWWTEHSNKGQGRTLSPSPLDWLGKLPCTLQDPPKLVGPLVHGHPKKTGQ